MSRENQPNTEAAILARVNALMSTRRKGGRRITKAAIRAQSANYAAANREVAAEELGEKKKRENLSFLVP